MRLKRFCDAVLRIDSRMPSRQRLGHIRTMLPLCMPLTPILIFNNDTRILKMGTNEHVTAAGVKIKGVAAIFRIVHSGRIFDKRDSIMDSDSFVHKNDNIMFV